MLFAMQNKPRTYVGTQYSVQILIKMRGRSFSTASLNDEGVVDKATILRCMAVSMMVAVIASFASTTLLSPAVGESVIDMSHMNSEAMENMSQEEALSYVESLPMKKVTGLERIFYLFSHPYAWYFYLRIIFTWFAGLFVATFVVSYWNGSSFNRSLKGDAASGAL